MHKTVAAMGGQLTLIATFPDQEPVVLTAGPVAKSPKSNGKKKVRKNAA